MNKKGFTLIELLVVITILGIVMLVAAIGVIPMIEKSEVKSLLNEGRELLKAADIAYNADSNMRGKSVCISMEYLYNLGYYDKSYKDKYEGSVLILNDGENIEKRFMISNEKGSLGTGGWADTTKMLKNDAEPEELYGEWITNNLHYASTCLNAVSGFSGKDDLNGKELGADYINAQNIMKNTGNIFYYHKAIK